MALQRGSWLPPERVIQEVKTEAAVFDMPSIEHHMLSLPQYSIGYTGHDSMGEGTVPGY